MLSQVEQVLVMTSMFALMVGMGTTLDWHAFKDVSKQPKQLLMGASVQFGVLPFIAWCLALALELSPEAALALILVGCTPGGTSSNMYTWFAKGNVALSITMTMCSTLAAVILMPALVAFYGSQLPLGELVVPWKQISGSLAFVLIPVGFGVWLRHRQFKHLLLVQRGGAALGIAAVFLMLASWLPSMLSQLVDEFSRDYIAVLLLGNLGFALGYGVTRLFGFDAAIARTLSLETGLQNTLLTFTIITLSFTPAFVERVGWIPLMYGACIMGMGMLWMLLFRYLAQKETRDSDVVVGASA